ncbi:MAG: hypothetical protein AB8B73_11950, partial [Ekhidna sp.]
GGELFWGDGSGREGGYARNWQQSMGDFWDERPDYMLRGQRQHVQTTPFYDPANLGRGSAINWGNTDVRTLHSTGNLIVDAFTSIGKKGVSSSSYDDGRLTIRVAITGGLNVSYNPESGAVTFNFEGMLVDRSSENYSPEALVDLSNKFSENLTKAFSGKSRPHGSS